MSESVWKGYAIGISGVFLIFVSVFSIFYVLGVREINREQRCVENCHMTEECMSYNWDRYGQFCTLLGYTYYGEQYLIRTYRIN